MVISIKQVPSVSYVLCRGRTHTCVIYDQLSICTRVCNIVTYSNEWKSWGNSKSYFLLVSGLIAIELFQIWMVPCTGKDCLDCFISLKVHIHSRFQWPCGLTVFFWNVKSIVSNYFLFPSIPYQVTPGVSKHCRLCQMKTRLQVQAETKQSNCGRCVTMAMDQLTYHASSHTHITRKLCLPSIT